jgi:hypothetical protein
MYRIKQNATIDNSFDKEINIYAILWQSGTRCAQGKEMDWHDVRR